MHKLSNEAVKHEDRIILQTTNIIAQYYSKLPITWREADIHPNLTHNILVSVNKPSNTRLTTIFYANYSNTKAFMYTDQTRKFPIVSSQDNRYIMVLYGKDSNLIFVE